MYNPEIAHPEFDLAVAEVRLGRTFQSSADEDVTRVASRAGVPVRSLLAMNAELGSNSNVAKGTSICVVYNQCRADERLES